MPAQRIPLDKPEPKRERDPDSLPDSTDPSGPCPRCGRVSSFTIRGTAGVTFRDGEYMQGPGGVPERVSDEQIAILECNGCEQCIVVVEEQLTGGVRGGRSGRVTHRGFHWWPAPGAAALGDDVPKGVADAYAEGTRCMSASAPNGAVAMFRNALAFIVDDKGSEAAKGKGDLKDAIKQMATDGTLTADLADWATHLRLYGNAGAHPDKFGDVTVEEARDVTKLTYTLIETLYLVPANIARRRAERAPK